MPGMTIVGSGHFVPGKPITNDDLAKVMDTSDEWIRPRSGIAQRHFVADGQGVSDLAFEASQRAIASADLEASEIDYIIFGTMTPEYIFPGSGSLLGAKLGISGVPALDVRQQCAFFPFSFQVADALIHSGAASTILLVGGNAHAGFMPWDWEALESGTTASPESYDFATKHRATAVLFGDGAGALVCRKHTKADHGFIAAVNHTDGVRHDHIYIPAGGFTRRHYWEATAESQIPQMRGRELFKCAVQRLPAVVRELCEKTGFTLEDIDFFLAHQANDRINAAVTQSLGIPTEKVPSNIANFGNTSDGTIPILMDEMRREDRFKEGDLVCFMALGAGLNWGAALMRI